MEKFWPEAWQQTLLPDVWTEIIRWFVNKLTGPRGPGIGICPLTTRPPRDKKLRSVSMYSIVDFIALQENDIKNAGPETTTIWTREARRVQFSLRHKSRYNIKLVRCWLSFPRTSSWRNDQGILAPGIDAVISNFKRGTEWNHDYHQSTFKFFQNSKDQRQIIKHNK